jgi:hypothetical protein
MIVGPHRVGRNPAAHRGSPVDIGDCGRGVGIAEADDGAQARIDPPRVKPPLGVASEPSHLARPPIVEPSIEKLRAIIQAAKRCEADQDEALLVRRCRKNFFQSKHQKLAIKTRRMLPCPSDAGHYRPVALVAQPLSSARITGTGFASRWDLLTAGRLGYN